MYGDSFVFGSAVDDEHSWGNQIAKRLSCRVQNFGVPGYGTDQAYLRFLHNDADQAPQVILNILFENVARNVNQNRGAAQTSGRFHSTLQRHSDGGEYAQRLGNGKAKHLCRDHVDDEIESDWLLDRDISRFGPAQNLVDMVRGRPEQVREIWSI
jgi:hypothetical protein